MPNTRVALVGYDAGLFAALHPVEEQLGERAISLLANAGRNEIPPPEHFESIAQEADVLLIGMSSPPNNALELRMIELADAYGKPVVGFADTFGADQRGGFVSNRDKIVRMLLSFEKDRDRAAKLWGCDDTIVTGNPAFDQFVVPALKRHEVREKLGLGLDRKVVFIPGTKQPAVNKAMLELTLKAAHEICRDYSDLVILFGTHPGDKTDLTEYDELAAAFKPVHYQRVIGMKGDDVVPGINAVIHPGNSSIALHALIRGRGGIRIIDCPYEGRTAFLEGEKIPHNATLEAQDMSYLPVSFEDFANTLRVVAVEGDLADRPTNDLLSIRPGHATRNIINVLNRF